MPAAPPERTIRSFDRSVVAHPKCVVRPRSVADLQAIVRDHERFPGPVRPVGSFHSGTPCAASDGTMVFMSGFRRVLDVDPEGLIITAEAGVQLAEAAAHLRPLGLQLPLNLEIGNITLGSAACCHTKDGLDGTEFGQLNSYLTRVRWVSPTGELREASEADDPALMSLVRSGYGLAGIVYETTFRLRPLELIRVRHVTCDAASITDELVTDVIERNQALVCWTVGRTVFLEPRTVAARLRVPWMSRLRRFFWSDLGAYVGQATLGSRGGRRLGPIAHAASQTIQSIPYRFSAATGGAAIPDPDKIIDYSRTPRAARYAFTFWAFPRTGWSQNLRDYLDFADRHYRRTGFRCNLPLGSYLIRGDRSSILSYSYDGDVISIDPIHAPSDRDRPDWERFLLEFNAWASDRGGVPLLNQSPLVNRAQVARAYGERWQVWSDWIRESDPGGRLLNPFFADLLAPPRPSTAAAAEAEGAAGLRAEAAAVGG